MTRRFENHSTLRSGSLLIACAIFALGGADAGAAPQKSGGGSRSSSGRMAQSSVSGANRSMNANHSGNGSGNNVASGNRGNNNKINTGDVNIGNDVNIHVDNDYGHHHGWGYDHPIAAGIAIGAVAVTTAAVIGSYYYALPPAGCTTVIRYGVSYHYCGSVYYQQTWSGNDVVYVVVNP